MRAVLQGRAHLRAVEDSSLALCRPRGSISEAKATRRTAGPAAGRPVLLGTRPVQGKAVRVALRPRRAVSASHCVRVALSSRAIHVRERHVALRGDR